MLLKLQLFCSKVWGFFGFALILEKITVQLFILWFPYGDLMSCVMLIEDVSRPIVMLRSNFILARRLDCINAIPRA